MFNLRDGLRDGRNKGPNGGDPQEWPPTSMISMSHCESLNPKRVRGDEVFKGELLT